MFPGPGTAGASGFTITGSGASPLTDNTFSIVLNTTGANTAASPWTFQVYDNNILETSSPIDLPAGTVIDAVGMQGASAVGSVSNFSLTSVPEPATLGLMGVGAVGLLLLKRRKTV